MEEKEEDNEFKEEIIIEKPIIIRNQPRKLNPKLSGKKILGKVGLRSSPPAPKQIRKKSNAEFLIDSIVKTFWTSKWKNQLTIMKYSKVGFNKKRGDFRNLCNKLNHSMKYHQYLYLAKLFDNMEKLPMREGVVHDDNYGKLKLIYNKKTEKEKESIKKENNENNIIYDDNGIIEIKIDMPEIVEVEYKPEEEQIKKKENNDNIIENNLEIQKESPPRLLNLNKRVKKIMNKGKKQFNNNIDNNNKNINKIKTDINNNENIENNNNNPDQITIKENEENIRPIKIEEKNNKTEKLIDNNLNDNVELEVNKDKNIIIEIEEKNKKEEISPNKEKIYNLPMNLNNYTSPNEIKKNKKEKEISEIIINNLEVEKKEEEKRLNPLSKKIKRIQEKYLGVNEKNKKSKKDRHSVITIRKKEDLEIDEEDNSTNKNKRVRKMSDFFSEYDEERISKSKRLQYKLRRIKNNKE